MQTRESMSVNSNDISISRSRQLDPAIPPSKIASLSSGEFVGMVADDITEKISRKIFHAEILNDHEAIRKETGSYKEIPKVREVTSEEVQDNYMQVKLDVNLIIDKEMRKLAALKKKQTN